MILGPARVDCTFENFICGASNQFAYAATQAVARKPGKDYNPLCLYASHSYALEDCRYLINAMANELNKTTPTNSHIIISDCCVAGSLECINNYDYDNVIALIIQNIQLIAGNDPAEKRVLDIYNKCYQQGKQIVFTSDRFPKDIDFINKGLSARMEWGLIADISTPNIETILAIIKQKAHTSKLRIPDDMALYIASEIMALSSYQDVKDLASRLIRFNSGSPIDSNVVLTFILDIVKVFNARESWPLVGQKIQLIDTTAELISLLRQDYSNIYNIGPENFEILVCERLSKMGYGVQRVGSVYAPDGGIDIVAWSTNSPLNYFLGVQVKHHMVPTRKTGPSAIKDMQAVLGLQPLQAGLIVTNTQFTPDAKWFAARSPHLVRLRDMNHLSRWIFDNFNDPSDRSELPSEIELAPGVIIKIPSK